MNTESVDTQVRQIAADIFNLPLSRVTGQTSAESVENWDSLQHLNFVLALEAAFGLRLEPEEVESIRTVGAAVDLVCGKLAGSS
jgi:acyl carrier protein